MFGRACHRRILKHRSDAVHRNSLTAMNVPGKKTMPRIEIVFLAVLSFLLSKAIVLMIALSSLLAFAIAAELQASSMLTFASFYAINW